jgi:hypothetical protein
MTSPEKLEPQRARAQEEKHGQQNTAQKLEPTKRSQAHEEFTGKSNTRAAAVGPEAA